MENPNDQRTLFRSALKNVVMPRTDDLVEAAKYLVEKHKLDKSEIGSIVIALAIERATFQSE